VQQRNHINSDQAKTFFVSVFYLWGMRYIEAQFLAKKSFFCCAGDIVSAIWPTLGGLKTDKKCPACVMSYIKSLNLSLQVT